MKVFRNGKEVSGATVIHDVSGTPVLVRVKGVEYDISAFELKEDAPVKRTANSSADKTKVTKPANDSVMTTKSTKKKAS